MIALPEGNAGKAAALAVLMIAVAAAYFTILSPILSLYAGSAERLEQRRELLRRDRNAVGDLPRLRALAKEHTKTAQSDDLLLIGETDAVAAAELQSALKEMIEENGARISSATTLPSALAGGFQRVGVRVAFSGGLVALTTVLAGIEGARPFFSLGNLDLHVVNAAERGDEDPNLDIALDVFGYRAK